MIGLPRDQIDDMLLAVAAMIAAASKWLQVGKTNQRLEAVEKENGELVEQLALITKERDALKIRLSIRSSLILDD